MADTLTNIQSDFRHYADASTETLTSGQGLRIANLIYQGMLTPDYRLLGIKVGRRWPEVTREDTSLTMIVGTEQYTWPATPDFKSPFYIEGLDTNSNNDPYPILEVPDMATWSAFDDNNNSRPTYYRLIDVAGTLKLALRHNPDQTDGIRITGLIEATEFTAGTDSTIFKNKNADRALAMFIAADYKSKRGDRGRALELVEEGVGLLPIYDTTPRLRPGGFIQPWGV